MWLEAETVGAVFDLLRLGAIRLDVVIADTIEELARIAADGAAVAGVAARSYYQYKAKMDSIDAESPWGRPAKPAEGASRGLP